MECCPFITGRFIHRRWHSFVSKWKRLVYSLYVVFTDTFVNCKLAILMLIWEIIAVSKVQLVKFLHTIIWVSWRQVADYFKCFVLNCSWLFTFWHTECDWNDQDSTISIPLLYDCLHSFGDEETLDNILFSHLFPFILKESTCIFSPLWYIQCHNLCGIAKQARWMAGYSSLNLM